MVEHTPTPWKLGQTLDKHPCIISTVTETRVREEDEANTWRKISCVNAFHSSTRTIPTEQISEGLVWKLYDALRAIAKALDAPRNRFGKLETDFAQGADLAGLLTQLKPDFPDIIPHGGEDNIDQTVMVIRALLTSLKVEEPE